MFCVWWRKGERLVLSRLKVFTSNLSIPLSLSLSLSLFLVCLIAQNSIECTLKVSYVVWRCFSSSSTSLTSSSFATKSAARVCSTCDPTQSHTHAYTLPSSILLSLFVGSHFPLVISITLKWSSLSWSEISKAIELAIISVAFFRHPTFALQKDVAHLFVCCRN